MRSHRPWIFTILPLTALLLIFSWQRLAGQGVALTLTPPEVELPQTGEAKVIALLDNKGTTAITGIRLSDIVGDGAAISIEPGIVSRLGPGSQCAWILSISLRPAGVAPSGILLTLNYRGANDVRGTIVQTLVVRPPQLQSLSALADLQVKGSTVALNKTHVGEVYLVVENKSSSAMEISPPTIQGVGRIRCEMDSSSLRLGPGQSRTVTVLLHADSAKTGRYLILFEIPCRWTEAGQERSGILRETREVEVGVPGVSEILSLLGVPSFLVLPGFLLLVAMGMSWRFVKPSDDAGDFPLKLGMAEFWLVAITYSIIAVWLYPLLGVTGDYIDGYTQKDVAGVWIVSIVAGFALYFLGLGVQKLVLEIKRRWYEFSENDPPEKVLSKFSHNGLRVGVRMVKVKEGAGEVGAYLLESTLEGKTKWLISPRMLLSRIAPDPEGLIGQAAKAIDAGDAARLSKVVERGMKDKVLSLRWDPESTLTGPRKVEKTVVTPKGTDGDIVSIV